ncbi:hypothetical protein [Gemmatimonas sp.]|uniref:hypothetical protein n=1 Tax=Gemmatimonas sp. TaxID=1962908 RepID=UPI00286D1890|nr:hypothetical protein [Gemmatimonas sp.]
MARVLAMQERLVAPVEREAYMAHVAIRRARAAAVPAHFWVFEHATESGRFVEFTEAASDDAIAAAHEPDQTPGLWREVQGG